MGDRVAVVNEGRLQQVDSPQNLYDNPVNVFVAAFIGSPSMNLFEGAFRVVDGSGVVSLGDQELIVPPQVVADTDLSRHDGHPIIVGIRPEDMEDASLVADRSQVQCLTASVRLVESLGSEILAHLDFNATTIRSGDADSPETLDTGATAVARFSPRSTVRAGQTMDVVVAVEQMHFFDADTQVALRGATR